MGTLLDEKVSWKECIVDTTRRESEVWRSLTEKKVQNK